MNFAISTRKCYIHAQQINIRPRKKGLKNSFHLILVEYTVSLQHAFNKSIFLFVRCSFISRQWFPLNCAQTIICTENNVNTKSAVIHLLVDHPFSQLRIAPATYQAHFKFIHCNIRFEFVFMFIIQYICQRTRCSFDASWTKNCNQFYRALQFSIRTRLFCILYN